MEDSKRMPLNIQLFARRLGKNQANNTQNSVDEKEKATTEENNAKSTSKKVKTYTDEEVNGISKKIVDKKH